MKREIDRGNHNSVWSPHRKYSAHITTALAKNTPTQISIISNDNPPLAAWLIQNAAPLTAKKLKIITPRM